MTAVLTDKENYLDYPFNMLSFAHPQPVGDFSVDEFLTVKVIG